jgi:hypothetical protein
MTDLKTSAARAAFELNNAELSKTAHETYTSESGHLQQSDLGKCFSLGVFNSMASILVLRSSTSLNIAEIVPVLVGLGLAQSLIQTLVYQSDRDFYKRERRREAWELKNFEEGEVKEMISHYINVHGFEEADSATVVKTLVKYKEAFVDFMMKEELGLVSPTKDSLVSLFSASIAGFSLASIILGAFFIQFPNSLNFTAYHHANINNSQNTGSLMGFPAVYMETIGLSAILLILGVLARSSSSTSVSKYSMLIGSISYLAAAVIAAVASISVVRLVNKH